MKKVKAACTWGYGPDVLVTNIGHPYLLYKDPIDKDKWTHGISIEGSFQLTADEAIKLAHDLLNAAMACKKLKESMQYQECYENNGKEM